MNSQVKKYGILAVCAVALLVAISSLISWSNQEVGLRNAFEQKMSERTAFYDKMWKTISQKSQVAIRNDSSFRTNINIIMAGRKDASQLVMKWITETNPNANFDQVTKLYQDLSRSIEAQREGFFFEEKVVQDIVRQHANLTKQFPGSFFNMVFSRPDLIYRPITSDRTDGAIKSGKDNDISVF